MFVLACDVAWTVESGSASCPGNLQVHELDNIPQGISLEDAQILAGHAVELFAIVAAALILQRAIR